MTPPPRPFSVNGKKAGGYKPKFILETYFAANQADHLAEPLECDRLELGDRRTRRPTEAVGAQGVGEH